MKITSLFLAAALASAGSVSFAENHAMTAMAEMAEMAEGDVKLFMAPMDKMMATMPMTSTGKPDADFLLMMIPHHQSAIEMAKVELEIGSDEKTKEMAQSMIDAQQKEIEEMRMMLKDMGIDTSAEPL